MADTKISGLTSDTATAGDQVPINRAGADGRVLVEDIAKLFPAAAASDQETGTSTTVCVVPNVQQRHPSALKFWARVTGDGTTLSESYNVTSKTDNGTGNLTITIATDFSDTTWCAILAIESSTTSLSVSNTRRCFISSGGIAAGTIQVMCIDATATTNVVKDPGSWHVGGFGDQ